MSILYLDCARGLSEKALFYGLSDFGVPPEIFAEVARAFPQGFAEVEQVLNSREPAPVLQIPTVESLPALSKPALEDLLINSSLTAKVKEDAREIITMAGTRSGCNSDDVVMEPLTLFFLLGALTGLEALHVTQVYCTPLPVRISDASDSLLEIIQNHHIPLDTHAASQQISLLMAAFLAKIAVFNQPPMKITRVSHAPLGGDYPPAGEMRLVLGEPDEERASRKMSLLQINIDDVTPQQSAYLIDLLTSSGALEVYQIPLLMKKNRMGMQLNVVARSEDEETLSRILFHETPTLGIRIFAIDEHPMIAYEVYTVQTRFGGIPVKIKLENNQVIGVQPEYEKCAEKAREHHVPLQQVMLAAVNAASEQIKKG
jgi:uncharacterized protein (DUF111 family)